LTVSVAPQDRSPVAATDSWQRAIFAAALLATDPFGLGGVVVRAAPGPVRDTWLALLQQLLGSKTAFRRVPAQVPDGRLLGGLDLTATLRAGRPVAERGILAEANGGVVVVPMAERLSQGVAARLAATLDSGEVAVERDGIALRWPAKVAVIALDEGLEHDERPPACLLDRLSLWIDLDGISPRGLEDSPWSRADIERAHRGLAGLADTAKQTQDPLEALCMAAQVFGIDSPRAALGALRAARAAAALAGRYEIEQVDCEMVARLVLAPRATRMPTVESVDEAQDAEAPPQDPAQGHDEPPSQESSGQSAQEDALAPPPDMPPPPGQQAPGGGDLQATPESDGDQDAMVEVVLAAVQSALPPGLIARLRDVSGFKGLRQPAGATRSGRAGAARADPRRGRPDGTQPGDPRRGPRLDLIATLRAAAPWQRLRRAQRGGLGSDQGVSSNAPQRPRIEVRVDDFRVMRRIQRATTTTIFVVDASGSSALHRLAEAKGAVQSLLAECYVRRDRVALISFHGKDAEVVLPPTRSLVRARRSLAGLPGGGGTPLAAGLEAGGALAESVRRQGDSPLLVVLTDGRGNIGRDRQPGRVQAERDALAAAQQWRLQGLSSLLVDTSARSHPAAQQLAQTMGARFLPLPYANAATLSAAVSAAVASDRGRGRAVRNAA